VPDLQLGANEIHVWLASCADIEDSALLDRYRHLMSAAEIERQQRYRFERDRHRDLITRALVRTTLSRYAATAPTDWSFHEGEHGKPEIITPENSELPSPLRFNLSHSRDRVVCAVTLQHDIGIDIEYTDRHNDVLTIAKHYFSASEREALLALPADRQRDAFFDYWTLKEAYIKARGEGISLGLAKFSFLLQQQPIGISFAPSFGDDAAAWQFGLYRTSPDYRMALAWRWPGPTQVRLFEGVPMQRFAERPGAY
jgi:4'-phosphopantetheinyl transferase